eukprot:CAMPEP_0197633818 /NCGR_PEP_ID=MMETSP1338-20131121/10090_1 /TAXON_ID=43686 ORGANISM="Pelagodinium beii, Strain RCC1491" /NCGR_SAMPLE_ID=MMETSP1338 /ASSEMBLY_ACC=CAM_ASM_000754 /LENGTH=141 /DNA_ID=CAMNT_0043205565 /DNA_START=123 /DNA_END=549 /DNA_ORIENTATION=+
MAIKRQGATEEAQQTSLWGKLSWPTQEANELGLRTLLLVKLFILQDVLPGLLVDSIVDGYHHAHVLRVKLMAFAVAEEKNCFSEGYMKFEPSADGIVDVSRSRLSWAVSSTFDGATGVESPNGQLELELPPAASADGVFFA